MMPLHNYCCYSQVVTEVWRVERKIANFRCQAVSNGDTDKLLQNLGNFSGIEILNEKKRQKMRYAYFSPSKY